MHLLQAVFAGFGQQQGQHVNALLDQGALLIGGGGAAYRAHIDLALMHLPGQVGKAAADVIGVGHHLA